MGLPSPRSHLPAPQAGAGCEAGRGQRLIQHLPGPSVTLKAGFLAPCGRPLLPCMKHCWHRMPFCVLTHSLPSKTWWPSLALYQASIKRSSLSGQGSEVTLVALTLVTLVQRGYVPLAPAVCALCAAW